MIPDLHCWPLPWAPDSYKQMHNWCFLPGCHTDILDFVSTRLHSVFLLNLVPSPSFHSQLHITTIHSVTQAKASLIPSFLQPNPSASADHSTFKTHPRTSLGCGTVDKNLPANAGDRGLTPGLGIFHMLRGATKPMHRNYRGLHLREPAQSAPEVCVPPARALEQEKPLQWEAHAPKRRVAPACCHKRKPVSINKDPVQPNPPPPKPYSNLSVSLFLAVLALCCCVRAFSSCGAWGPFSRWGAWASLFAEHRLPGLWAQ